MIKVNDKIKFENKHQAAWDNNSTDRIAQPVRCQRA